MRYFIVLMTGLILMACNLSTPATLTVIEATPTAIIITPDEANSVEQTGNITFWQSFLINDLTPAEGDIVIIEQIVLRRMESDIPRTGIAIIDLERALQSMFDTRDISGYNITIESLTIADGLATIELNGNISAVGGAILSMASLQLRLTAFEEDSIDALLMTLNGDNIGNFGISHDSQAVPEDYTFIREILYQELGRMP